MAFVSVPSHIWDGTVAVSQIFWDLEELMRDGFCDWCVKCAKYLAFGTFERADDSALIYVKYLIKLGTKHIWIYIFFNKFCGN